MSFFSSIGKIFRTVGRAIIPTAIGAIPGIGPIASQFAAAALAPRAPAPRLPVRRPLPGAGFTPVRGGLPALRSLPMPGFPTPRVPFIPIPGQEPGASTGTLMTATGCPPGFHPNKQPGRFGPARTYCVRNRRMDFMNAKAAKRAVRRIKSARKTLQDIEKLLPRAKTRRVPHHHHRTA